MAHFEKRKYYIVGYFSNTRKYGLKATRLLVNGYICKEYPEIGIRKDNSWWYIDHIKTGFLVWGNGFKTREQAINAYIECYKEKVDSIKPDVLEKAEKTKADLYSEEFLNTFETVEFGTIKDHRLDKITDIAKYHGCIIRKNENDHGSYLHGGSMLISGSPGMLKPVLEQIESYDKIDRERMEQSIEQPEKDQKQPETTEKTNTEQEQPEQEQKQDSENTESTENLESLEESGESWKETALTMLSMRKSNENLILSAGIEADIITLEQIKKYFETGIMPEIHTFDSWIEQGYKVRKGEKAAFQARIWKHTEKAASPDNEQEKKEKYLFKIAYFFTKDQVDKICNTVLNLPDDCKITIQGNREIISGNTYKIRDQIKNAGYIWHKKNKMWYRPVTA